MYRKPTSNKRKVCDFVDDDSHRIPSSLDKAAYKHLQNLIAQFLELYEKQTQELLYAAAEDVLNDASDVILSILLDDIEIDKKKHEIFELLKPLMIAPYKDIDPFFDALLTIDAAGAASVVDCEEDNVHEESGLLNLEKLAFSDRGFFCSTKYVQLPVGSVRKRMKGYSELRVPVPPVRYPSYLVKINDVPDWAQPSLKGIEQLDIISSQVYDTALFTNDNILLCAPVQTAETHVALLTILHLIAPNTNRDIDAAHKTLVVYLAPKEACVTTISRFLSCRLQHFLHVQVKGLGSDQNFNCHQVEGTQILVTTPEKWDTVDWNLTKLVKLLIVDQIHVLHDDKEGPVLEGILARILREKDISNDHMRLVGFSAPIVNHRDVASFLKIQDKGIFFFGNSYRPYPLSLQLCSDTVQPPLKALGLMSKLCCDKALSVVGKHQIVVFVHSARETTKTACEVRDTALARGELGCFLKEDSKSRVVLKHHAGLVGSKDLKDLLPLGFAVHHAGLDARDSQLVQNLFTEGHVQLLVSTSDLAWSVHLPAHTVIIKGAHFHSHPEVIRMLAFPERPQDDPNGEIIILTALDNMYFCALIAEQLPIESQLVSKLPWKLKSEIHRGTVQNVKEACDWIGHTYLYVRMLQSPTLYGLALLGLDIDRVLDKRRIDLVSNTL
ncbi:Dexh-box atp-dependent rna helicase dexh12 [Thalictrum thalictroides]|uniref:Dexh-box atp-dependent rna helicase dexh12 n=1 Tax=Thalictrum thalictroides TaxID=46969 RepID=A0A7J6VTJ1_THATH|nr:Dexh-box atp-dependent rna helicase dexh12 [Thalictrum thalictroides]